MTLTQGPGGLRAWSVTVGTKGQIVIPKEAREMFGIEPGATLLLLGDPVRGIAIPPRDAVAALHTQIFGGEGAEPDGNA
ncbi:MAG: AbrB/MazE/SpoVT family DNA-binding domain-containing protein [Clostridia bacterium]|nr:AbrB/MazE/SpoVT family DNA-binding domain-containing protein [Clostridia bacterium]